MSGGSSPRLGLPGHTAPIEREYRAIADAMMRCARSEKTFDARAYDPAAVVAARHVWTVRMDAEYQSTSVFSAMTAQLMEAGASLDAVAVVLRMAQDEVRHAEVCGRAVDALGGDARFEPPHEIAPLSRHAGCTPQERALRNVIYGCCLSEVVNTARFVDVHDTMTDPYLRDVTRQLLSDEVLHGQFGFHYLEAWRGWLDDHPEVRASLGRYLRHAFALLERQLSGAGAPAKTLTADERALGIPDQARLPDTFYQTVAGAVIPGLERFGIEAGEAWRSRRPGG
ncbi:MAG: ferritin-like domain-containing protein [Polyangiaceae bacterium]